MNNINQTGNNTMNTMNTMKLSAVNADRPINLICHKGDINVVNDTERVELDPQRTVAAADSLGAADVRMLVQFPRFQKLYQLVMGANTHLLIDSDTPMNEQPLGVRHVIGLILLGEHAISEGRQLFLRQPESYLHPSQQVGLADLLIEWSLNSERGHA